MFPECSAGGTCGWSCFLSAEVWWDEGGGAAVWWVTSMEQRSWCSTDWKNCHGCRSCGFEPALVLMQTFPFSAIVCAGAAGVRLWGRGSRREWRGKVWQSVFFWKCHSEETVLLNEDACCNLPLILSSLPPSFRTDLPPAPSAPARIYPAALSAGLALVFM